MIFIISGNVFLNSLHNNSYWLIDNGNGGFVGRSIKENIYYFSSIIDNQYFNYGLLVITITFFILSLSIKPNEIVKVLIFPVIIIKKIFSLLKKNKNDTNTNRDDLSNTYEKQEFEDNAKKNQQPILPFTENKSKEVKIQKSTFKLPGVNFLEKNGSRT